MSAISSLFSASDEPLPVTDGAPPLQLEWRRQKSAAFRLEDNSSGRETLKAWLWQQPVEIYRNANLSVYSAQPCNARCPFCVEELRPASRGTELSTQKTLEQDDDRYFAALEEVLSSLRWLNPSVSVTGGEPSLDPRLPTILQLLQTHQTRKRTLTTNGSGLLLPRAGRAVLDHVIETGIAHLNISIAHPNPTTNARIMQLPDTLSLPALKEIVARAREGGVRVRLSCVLLRDACAGVPDLHSYLAFASSLGVDNVIFRQLMQVDATRVLANAVTRYSDKQRVLLEPILDALSQEASFVFQRQVMGYYYYVEVWRYLGTPTPLDVVFEEADLAQLEREKRLHPGRIHELIFHPNAKLATTWQPWDGVLGPPAPAAALPSFDVS